MPGHHSGQRRDADRYGGSGRSRHKDVTGTDPADPNRLQDRDCATDHDGNGNRPKQKRLRLTRGAEHNRRNQHCSRHNKTCHLQAETGGKHCRNLLVGVATGIGIGIGQISAHVFNTTPDGFDTRRFRERKTRTATPGFFKKHIRRRDIRAASEARGKSQALPV